MAQTIDLTNGTISDRIYLIAHRYAYTKPGEVSWWLTGYAQEVNGNTIGCWSHDITLPLPSDFNPIAAEVAALNASKVKALADYQEAVAELNDRLGKLLALEAT